MGEIIREEGKVMFDNQTTTAMLAVKNKVYTVEESVPLQFIWQACFFISSLPDENGNQDPRITLIPILFSREITKRYANYN
jgi:hypothetical protein